MDRPTDTEIAKVHRYECVMNGHSWSIISVYGSEDPVRLMCRHCGRTLEIASHQGSSPGPHDPSQDGGPGH